jgi:hypothetical protein
MQALITSKGQPIPPLTRGLLPTMPPFLRWPGWLNNRWNETVVEALLETRCQSMVIELWDEAALPNTNHVERMLAAIGDEMSWKYPRFIPQDECFLVLKLWWHGVSDCWERERCMWAIEKICGKRPPSSILPNLADMTLGDLFVHFQE